MILMVVNIFYEISAVGGQSFSTIIACGGILLMFLAEIFQRYAILEKKSSFSNRNGYAWTEA